MSSLYNREKKKFRFLLVFIYLLDFYPSPSPLRAFEASYVKVVFLSLRGLILNSLRRFWVCTCRHINTLFLLQESTAERTQSNQVFYGPGQLQLIYGRMQRLISNMVLGHLTQRKALMSILRYEKETPLAAANVVFGVIIRESRIFVVLLIVFQRIWHMCRESWNLYVFLDHLGIKLT